MRALNLLTIGALFAVFVCKANGDEPKPVHKLPGRGRTLIEAEDYSAVSKDFPYAVEHIDPSIGLPPAGSTARKTRIPCSCGSAFCKISGKKHLGFFWANSSFELDLDVSKLLNYHLSLRTASPEGTKLEVWSAGSNGVDTKLASIEIPGTGAWSSYTKTKDVVLTLRPGKQTLRFVNRGNAGANVDYLTFTAGALDDLVTYRPKANNGPTTNPLKGFSSGWWREDDYASVGFQYLEWGKLEPKDDAFDWDAVEEVLNRAGTKDKHVILQFAVDWDYSNPVDKDYRGPKWLLDRVGEHRGTADPEDPNSRQMRATRYNNPVFIAEAKEAIEALVGRYKNDPRIFVIQVGVLGFWGEWHTFPRTDWSPTDETKAEILQSYMDSLGPNGLTQVRYPNEPINKPQHRMGYTNGSAVPTPHGYKFGKAIAESKLWKNGPVHGEWPPNVTDEFWKKFFLTDEGDRFIQQARYSTLLVPENKEIASRLASWKPEGRFLTMHQKMGYSFRVDAVRHLPIANQSGTFHVEVDLKNTGMAPFYKKWNVQLAVLETKTGEVAGSVRNINTDLRKMMPGDSATLSTVLNAKLDPRRRYQLGLRIVQPGADLKKSEVWPLSPRNTYVVLSNELSVIDGVWNEGDHALKGGWNLLNKIQPRQPQGPDRLDTESSRLFPFEGSFRPARDDNR
ncbi:MAG: DUF4832 domain-containing protein [Planctomycetaceae bacterium]